MTDAPGSARACEHIACPDCGLIQRLPLAMRREVLECARCTRVLASRATGRVDLPLALSSCALLFLIAALATPLMSVSTLGAERTNGLYSGVSAFARQGFPSLAALTFICTVLLPFVYTGALVWVLGSLHVAREGARMNPALGSVYRWVRALRPWMMLEVFLIGGFVAYTRIDAVASIEVGFGGWCLMAATFVLLLALTQLDDRTVWSSLAPHVQQAIPPAPAGEIAHTHLACTVCDLIVPQSREGSPCPRCQARLHQRKPDAVRRTVALLIAGYLLYIPANLLPVLTLEQFGRSETNTIMSGVLELIHNNLWPLAVIVFVASIVLPLMKLFGLTWMLASIQLRSGRHLHTRTRLFRMIDLIGRWSNIDVFMGSVLVGLLQFGALVSVRAGSGLVAFAAVVVLTMIATETFDARLMWDAARRRTE